MPESLDLGSLQPLAMEWQPLRGQCPFVVDSQAANHVTLAHYSGGRDATYVVVSRKSAAGSSASDRAVTIRYAPFVEGTAIIYDATAHAMQGKARPFVGDLTQQAYRLYAVLPFQIEQTLLRMTGVGDQRLLQVSFVDARGESIQAALPFELQCLDPQGKIQHSRPCTTDRHGRCQVQPLGKVAHGVGTKVSVRSLLTGQAAAICHG